MNQEKIEDTKGVIRSCKSKIDNGMVQKYKQWSRKHYTNNERLTTTNPTKTGVNSGALEG